MLKFFNTTYKCFFLIAFLWFAAIVFVNPVGDFPLNDDWAYAKTVKSFIDRGQFEFNDPSMTLIGHVLLGIVFCKIFGFSFTVLRLYVLLSGLIGLFFSFLILKKISSSVQIALVGTLILLFNPVFFQVSFSYMTDVPFFCFCCITIYYNLKYIESGKTSDFIAATLAAFMATLIRQPGILIPFSFIIVYFFDKNRNNKVLISISSQFVLSVVVMLFYELYLKYQLGYPRNSVNVNANFLQRIIYQPIVYAERLFLYTMASAVYLGLFISPLCSSIIRLIKKELLLKKTIQLVAAAMLISILVVVFYFELHEGKRIPFMKGCIITNFGLGSILLRYNFNLLFQMPIIFWDVLMVLGFFSMLLFISLVVLVLYKCYAEKNRPDAIFLFPVVFIALYLPIIIGVSFFDRYLILPLFLLLFLFSAIDSKEMYSAKLNIIYPIVIVTFALFSVLGTKDYLSANRARWQALNELTNVKKISPESIDGGYEFNGWYNYGKTRNLKNLFTLYKDDYLVALVPENGYHIIARYPYQRFIPYRKEDILVLERDDLKNAR